MNLQEKFIEYLEKESEESGCFLTDKEIKKMAKDYATIANEHKVVIAEGIIDKDEDSISLFVSESAGCSIDGYDLLSRIYQKYQGKKVKINVEVQE